MKNNKMPIDALCRLNTDNITNEVGLKLGLVKTLSKSNNSDLYGTLYCTVHYTLYCGTLYHSTVYYLYYGQVYSGTVYVQ